MWDSGFSSTLWRRHWYTDGIPIRSSNNIRERSGDARSPQAVSIRRISQGWNMQLLACCEIVGQSLLQHQACQSRSTGRLSPGPRPVRQRLNPGGPRPAAVSQVRHRQAIRQPRLTSGTGASHLVTARQAIRTTAGGYTQAGQTVPVVDKEHNSNRHDIQRHLSLLLRC